MKKLPIYILVDVSGSMDGYPIHTVMHSLEQLVSDLRSDRRAVECAYLSVITFSDEAHQVVPLTEVECFQVPDLTAYGRTALGPALSLLCECRDRDLASGTPSYLPIVIILTDGQPTEGDFNKGIQDFKSRKWGNCACCAIGQEVDLDSLKRISDDVVQLPGGRDMSSDDFTAFYKKTISI